MPHHQFWNESFWPVLMCTMFTTKCMFFLGRKINFYLIKTVPLNTCFIKNFYYEWILNFIKTFYAACTKVIIFSPFVQLFDSQMASLAWVLIRIGLLIFSVDFLHLCSWMNMVCNFSTEKSKQYEGLLKRMVKMMDHGIWAL